MSTHSPQSDVPSLDEEIVAYLDGELDDQAARRLEERLANDERARARLHSLATSWDLLDHLPKAALDDDFTRTTVQMVALAASEDVAAQAASLPARRRRRLMAAAVAALAAAVVGFVAVVAAWPDPNEPLLRDLPVVKSFDAYEVTPRGDAVEFLRGLDNAELFIIDPPEEASGDDSTFEPTGPSATRDVVAARRAEIEALSGDQKKELRKLFERYREKAEEEKERLRSIDAQLREQPDEARLRAVLESYHNWLPTLSPLERADLRKMSTDEAIAEVRRLKQRELTGLAQLDMRQGPLTQRDVDVIQRWQQDRAWKRKDEILQKASEQDREWFNDLSDEQQRRSLVFLALPPRPGPPPQPELNASEWQDLLNQIPAVKALFTSRGKAKEAEEALKSLAGPIRDKVKEDIGKAATPEEQQRLLFGWQMAALRARDAVGGGVSRKELKRFFEEEMKEEDREKLSLLPPEEFHRKLRFHYFVQKELPPGRWKRGPWGRGSNRGRSRFDDERGRRRGSADHDDDDHQRRDGPPHERKQTDDEQQKSNKLRSED